MCASVGAGLGLGSGMGLGSGSRLRWTSVQRCEGADVGSGVFPVRCRGARVACVGVGGSVRPAAALAFAVAFRMRAAGRGGSEDVVEEVDEAQDAEEVVDAGLAVMRAGLRAAASAAATAGRMKGMSSGCRWGAGGWGGPVVTWRPGGPIWSAAAGEGGAGLWPSPFGLGLAAVLHRVRLCGLASEGGNSSRGLHSEGGGGGPGSSGVCAGDVGGRLGGVGVPRGAGLLSADVCGLSSVGGGEGCQAGGCVAGVCWCSGGWGRPLSRGPGVCAMVGVCGSPGDQREERGLGGDRAVGCVVSVYVSARRSTLCVASCRPGGLEEKLAVFCCCGKDFADELAYLVDLLVSCGKGVC